MSYLTILFIHRVKETSTYINYSYETRYLENDTFFVNVIMKVK